MLWVWKVAGRGSVELYSSSSFALTPGVLPITPSSPKQSDCDLLVARSSSLQKPVPYSGVIKKQCVHTPLTLGYCPRASAQSVREQGAPLPTAGPRPHPHPPKRPDLRLSSIHPFNI